MKKSLSHTIVLSFSQNTTTIPFLGTLPNVFTPVQIYIKYNLFLLAQKNHYVHSRATWFLFLIVVNNL